jgi:hypothetical protein
VHIEADDANSITEIDEGNNTRVFTVPISPRSFAASMPAGVNMIAQPLEPDTAYTARSLAEFIGASQMISYDDSLSQFVTFIPDFHTGDGFPIVGSVSYIAILDDAVTSTFEGMTHIDSVNMYSGLNMTSLPLDPDSAYTAKDFCGASGALQVIRYATATGEFETYICGFHTGDGFEINGGEGYIVISPEDTTVKFVGSGWMNGGVPKVAKSMLAGKTSRQANEPAEALVFAVVGRVPTMGRPSRSSICEGCRVHVLNNTNGREVTGAVDPSTGEYGAVFVDITNRAPITADQLIEVSVLGENDISIGGKVSHVIRKSDIAKGYVVLNVRALELPPAKTLVATNYPNPFNPSTTISYQLAQPGHVSLLIFNSAGQLVKTLVDEEMKPGYYTVEWFGRNERDEMVASGMYFYEFKAPGYKKTKKMVLLK